jgi:hypothetical protein
MMGFLRANVKEYAQKTEKKQLLLEEIFHNLNFPVQLKKHSRFIS